MFLRRAFVSSVPALWIIFVLRDLFLLLFQQRWYGWQTRRLLLKTSPTPRDIIADKIP
jgi:hypothetical protein